MTRTMHTCPYCETSWFEREPCSDCLFRSLFTGDQETCATCNGSREGGPAAPHVCPTPYPIEVAQSLVSMGSPHSPVIVSQTQRARALLALRGTQN